MRDILTIIAAGFIACVFGMVMIMIFAYLMLGTVPYILQ